MKIDYSKWVPNVISIFIKSIDQYHEHNDVDKPVQNTFEPNSIEYVLFNKCYIDTVQWHLEDIIRDTEINPVEALTIKRRIDSFNQKRTDMVEKIDDYFLDLYKDNPTKPDAHINTESPAWAIDRLSILQLKIYHMKEETNRKSAPSEHIQKCTQKLNILLEQEKDVSLSIQQLLEDIENGDKKMKVYRQMKMYNDPNLNPVLYKHK